jgi:hypothetical protein
MPWQFDPNAVDIVFIVSTMEQIVSGSIDFGDNALSDLAIDVGQRENDTSILDSGLRIIDGNI